MNFRNSQLFFPENLCYVRSSNNDTICRRRFYLFKLQLLAQWLGWMVSMDVAGVLQEVGEAYSRARTRSQARVNNTDPRVSTFIKGFVSVQLQAISFSISPVKGRMYKFAPTFHSLERNLRFMSPNKVFKTSSISIPML